MFFVDGFGQKTFDEALAEGRIPNISRHLLQRGVHVESAVACLPTITYANAVTFLTGRYPGRHGIVSNKWFEPSTDRFEDYTYIRTYQHVDEDYTAPTIYELLPGRQTVSIEAAMRRGCTQTIDNWATSGLNWFVSNYTGVDCLVTQSFEELGSACSWRGRWPDFIMAYFPASDTIAHRFGPESVEYKRSISLVDLQIGRICENLQAIGMYDHTYLVLVSDHGMASVDPENSLDIAQLLRDRAGARVWFNHLTESSADLRALRECDFAVAMSASRWAAIYPVPGRQTRHTEELAALTEALRAYEAPPGGSASGKSALGGEGADESPDNARTLLPPWLREAVEHPAVELMACSFRPGKVHLFTRTGHAVVTRTVNPVERHTVWQQPSSPVFGPEAGLRPASPLLHPAPEMLAETESSEASDSRVWLQATARTRYPDLVPQIAAMFESERAGTFVFFAAVGWGFAPSDFAGGHGSTTAEDVRVPMLFAGPGLPAGGTIPTARNSDVMPTVLELLGAKPVKPNGDRVDMDGISLLPCSGDRPEVDK